MTEMYIPLKDEEGNELPYRIDQIFSVEGSEQLYCAAVYYGVDTVESEVVFLKCDLKVNGDNTEIELFDILDADEYERIVAAYQTLAMQTAAQSVEEELAENEDFLTVVDKDGNERTFIVHLIFEDDTSEREYIAVQEVDKEGNILEEIALYRFKEGDDTATIEMIPSDMEYERARNVFVGLIEADAGIS